MKYTFRGWSGDCSGTSASCAVTMTSNKSAHASFDKRYCYVTATAGSGGSVSGGGNVHCGVGSTTITATADTNYCFDDWSGGLGRLGTSDTTCQTTASITITKPETDLTVTANFEKRTYTFTVTASGGGSASGGGTYKHGESATATATWDSVKYTFRGWSKDCRGTNASCTVTMTSNKSAHASFDKRYCYVTATAGSGGSVSGGGNVHCGVGSTTITATADTNYCFDTWGGGLGGQEASATTCQTTASITITKPETALTVTANFKKKTYTLTVNGGTGSGTYDANTWVSISAPAAQCVLGFSLIFDQWTGDSTSTSRTTRIYMSRDKTVTATYTASTTPCSLSASPDGVNEGPGRGVADAAERPPLSLLVISDGATDALDLEWLGGPLNASRWQYRMRAAGAESWGDWTDIPASTADTRAYRVSGLNGATGYRFQVRPVVGGSESTPSNASEGATQEAGAGHPQIAAHHIAEGDGETQWRLHNMAFVITIPDGMRLRAGEAGQTSVTAQDMGSGSYLTLSTAGAELGREVLADPVRNVGALFDQIIASVTASSSEQEMSDDQP